MTGNAFDSRLRDWADRARGAQLAVNDLGAGPPRRRRRRVDRRGLPLEQESKFQDAVVELARLSGWETHHEHDSRRSSEGWPDLEMVRPPRHLRAELKVPPPGRTADDELSPAQRRIVGKLRQCPQLEVYVWGPDDWPEIQRTLTRR